MADYQRFLDFCLCNRQFMACFCLCNRNDFPLFCLCNRKNLYFSGGLLSDFIMWDCWTKCFVTSLSQVADSYKNGVAPIDNVNWGYVSFICSGQGFRSEASVGIEVVEPAAVGGRQERLHAETARCFAVHFGIIEEEDV